ncbi:MAG: hypothetical protein DRG78_04905 [Epsilonproteobacteria bacterium]|nr:MAG: hypothetical protein DRG78_04905 [Campylobacterota bacterium]
MQVENLGKLKNINNEDVKTTHKDTQSNTKQSEVKNAVGRQKGSKTKKEQANVSLSVALTPTQKKQLIAYAKADDRTAGYIIKKLLLKEGIIEDNKL